MADGLRPLRVGIPEPGCQHERKAAAGQEDMGEADQEVRGPRHRIYSTDTDTCDDRPRDCVKEGEDVSHGVR